MSEVLEKVTKIENSVKTVNRNLTKLSKSVDELLKIRRQMTLMIRSLLLITGLTIGFAAGVIVSANMTFIKDKTKIITQIEKSEIKIPKKPRIIKSLGK